MLQKFKSYLRKFYRKIFYHTPPDTIQKQKKKYLPFKQVKLINGGDLNKDKIFYVIQRFNGEGGLFSDLTFVVNHLKVANDYGFIPIVDMENFPRWYNEKKKIKQTFNSWNYYFKPVSKFSLEEVYKSKNIVLTLAKFYSDIDFKYQIEESKDLKQIYKKYIEIDKKILRIVEILKKDLFQKNKILGVHFRGTSYKYGKNPYPATITQMKDKIHKIIKTDRYDKIFLVTEDIKHFDALKKEFNDKIIYLKNSYRSTGKIAFSKYPRLNHRYKLGRDILIETCLLSYCDGYLDTEGNIRSAVLTMNFNLKQIRYIIDNGFNPGLPFIGNYIWYIKSILPSFLGGFRI
jgi:hypothetical protein